MNEKIQFVTFTNSGYINFTNNLLESIKINKIDINLKIFAIDDDSFNYFKNIHDNVERYYQEKFSSKLIHQKENNFGSLMLIKFDIIYRSLLENKYVGYIDGDIVIKKNIDGILLPIVKDLDILFQNDKRPSKPNLINVCAGFMIINSNKKTKKFFKPSEKLNNKFLKYKTHDQTHINKNLSKFKYKMLPLDAFPNGPHFYTNHENLDPYIVHFNYLLGEKKEDSMKTYKEWYLT
jgi:hypothetical protein